MADRVVVQMAVDPATRGELIAITHEILRETRAYPGCTYAAVWIPEDDEGALWTVLGWETREHFHAYTAWRRETNSMERLQPFLRGLPKIGWIRIREAVPPDGHAPATPQRRTRLDRLD